MKIHRRFLTPRDMAEMKLDESIAYSNANRYGKKLAGVRQYPCGCEAEGCNITIPLEQADVHLPKAPKRPTKHPKRKEHSMFRGRIIE